LYRYTELHQLPRSRQASFSNLNDGGGVGSRSLTPSSPLAMRSSKSVGGDLATISGNTVSTDQLLVTRQRGGAVYRKLNPVYP
jgi:hypothetical protein